jgi:RES domain-containing protein
MTRCYRIVKKELETGAFSGDGAAEHPGRWNHRGYRVVYTAESRSLASLEIMVNMGRESTERFRYSVFTVTVPERVKIAHLNVSDLPSRWRGARHLDATKDIGTLWLKGVSSAVLSVPSSVIPSERDYLLNPVHPDFVKITISAPESFSFDSRLLKKLRG